VTLRGGADEAAARAFFLFCRTRLPAYARPRRVEFNLPLPKTVSGKIQRAQLRALEAARFTNAAPVPRRPNEWWETDVGMASL
jgi:acyl-coenzyme A synthetase/AMP-(fatty) acid ligase